MQDRERPVPALLVVRELALPVGRVPTLVEVEEGAALVRVVRQVPVHKLAVEPEPALALQVVEAQVLHGPHRFSLLHVPVHVFLSNLELGVLGCRFHRHCFRHFRVLFVFLVLGKEGHLLAQTVTVVLGLPNVLTDFTARVRSLQ